MIDRVQIDLVYKGPEYAEVWCGPVKYNPKEVRPLAIRIRDELGIKHMHIMDFRNEVVQVNPHTQTLRGFKQGIKVLIFTREKQ